MIEKPPALDDKKEERPIAAEALERLMEKSKFTRLDRENPDTVIELKGRQFTIEKIPDGQSETIKDVQDLFGRTFGEEEIDPEEILRAAIDGKTPWGQDDMTRYNVHVIKDESGEVVSTVTGGRLQLRNADGTPLDKQMFMVAYTVTDEKARLGGLAREAFGNDAALERHREHVQGIWKTFKEQVEDSEWIVFMSKDERERAMTEGMLVLEHSAADHGHMGEEDF